MLPVWATTPEPVKFIRVAAVVNTTLSSEIVKSDPPPLPESRVIVSFSTPLKIEALTSVTALPVNSIYQEPEYSVPAGSIIIGI